MKPPFRLPFLFSCLLAVGCLLCLFGLQTGVQPCGLQPLSLAVDSAEPTAAAALTALPWAFLIVALILLMLWMLARRNRK